MSTIGELLVKLGMDPASYTSGLSKAESETKSSTGNIGKHFDDAGSHASKFGSIMSGIGTGIGIAAVNLATDGIGKMTDFLGAANKEFQDAAVSTAQLTTAYNNAGVGYAATGDAMESNLKRGNDLGYSQDEQRSSLALLIGVTKDADGAQNDLSEAENLARLRKIDLASATNIVIKAQEGNLGALKKLGIEVSPVTAAVDALKASTKNATAEQLDAAKAADKQATATAALTALDKLAGGQADAYANTSAGKLAAAHEKVTEAMEKLGGIMDKVTQAVMPALAGAFSTIMDAVEPVIAQLSDAMPGAIATVEGAIGTLETNLSPIITTLRDTLAGAIQTVRDHFNDVVSAIGSVVRAITPFVNNALKPLQETFKDITSNQDKMKGALIVLGVAITALVVPPMLAWAAATLAATWPILAIIAGVAALIVVLDKTGMLDWLGKNVLPALSAAADWLATNVLPVLSAAFDWIVTNVLPPLSQAFDFLSKNVLPALEIAGKLVFDAIATYVKIAVAVFSTEFDILKTAIGVIAGLFDGLKTGIGAVWDGISTAVKAGVNGIIGFINILIGALDAIQMHMHFSIPNPLGGTLASANFDWNGMGIAKIQTLHGGGIVQGAPGSDVLTLLQAGERVTSRADVARGQGGGNTFYITNPVPEPVSVSMAHANLMMAYSGRSGN